MIGAELEQGGTAMEDRLADRPARPSTIPLAVWLLLAGALFHLAVTVVPDWYRLFGPYLQVDLGMVIGWVSAVAPFLLGAAVILGADRWAAGRHHLLLGALALGAVGLLALGLDVFVALWEPSPGDSSSGISVLFAARFIAAAVMFVVAFTMLAAGLWVAVSPRPGSARRRMAMGFIGVAGIVALAAGLWAVSVWLTVDAPTAEMGVYIFGGVLTALGGPAMAALAIASVRAMPARGGLPEALIASGAVGAMAGTAWEFTVPSAIPQLNVSPELFFWLFTVPGMMIALGMGAMIAGFAGAALAGRPRVVADPAA